MGRGKRLFPSSLQQPVKPSVFSLSGWTASVLSSFAYRPCFLESWSLSRQRVQATTISVNHIIVTSKTKLAPGFLNSERSKGLLYVYYKLYLYFCNVAPYFPSLQQHEMLIFTWFSIHRYSPSIFLEKWYLSVALYPACMHLMNTAWHPILHLPHWISFHFFQTISAICWNWFGLLASPVAYILFPHASSCFHLNTYFLVLQTASDCLE